MHKTHRLLEELWLRKINLVRADRAKACFVQLISICASWIFHYDLPVFMEYRDDLRGNFKKMYGEKEQKLTTGLLYMPREEGWC